MVDNFPLIPTMGSNWRYPITSNLTWTLALLCCGGAPPPGDGCTV